MCTSNFTSVSFRHHRDNTPDKGQENASEHKTDSVVGHVSSVTRYIIVCM
jgi:hypothetical protein